MYCSNCGKELKEKYKFCPGCGKEVETHSSVVSDEKMYDEVYKFVLENKKASISSIQKEFGISYNKASKMIDLLEEKGVIGPQNGNKPREILLDEEKNNIEENIKSSIESIMDTADTTSNYDKKDIKDNILLAILSYIGLLVFIPYFIPNDSKFVKYHATQGMNLLILWGAYTLIDNILELVKVSKVVVDFAGITGTKMVTPIWISFPMNVLGLFLGVVSIIGIVYACEGKAKELPLIGKLKIVK